MMNITYLVRLKSQTDSWITIESDKISAFSRIPRIPGRPELTKIYMNNGRVYIVQHNFNETYHMIPDSGFSFIYAGNDSAGLNRNNIHKIEIDNHNNILVTMKGSKVFSFPEYDDIYVMLQDYV